MEISKVGAAVCQIDWAIKLLMDHHSPLPAITLAAAADEILARLVPLSAMKESAAELAKLHGLNEKLVRDEHLNKAKNWLKHNDEASDESIDLDIQTEAIQLIARALVNLARHDQSITSEGVRFAIWLQENRPDLWDESSCG